jgi:hypothetical protein
MDEWDKHIFIGHQKSLLLDHGLDYLRDADDLSDDNSEELYLKGDEKEEEDEIDRYTIKTPLRRGAKIARHLHS